MKPRGRSRKTPLTQREQRQIVVLTRKGMTQVVIARRLRLTRSTVQRWQRKLNCAPEGRRNKTLERRIAALSKQHLGSRRIALALNISRDTVRRALRRLGIAARAPGQPRTIPNEVREKLRAAILRRDDYAAGLARKHGVSASTALRIAHEVWGNGNFFSAQIWPPLQSPFPQTWPDATAGADVFVRFVESVVEKCCDGKLPTVEQSIPFVAGMMLGFVRLNPGQDQRVYDCAAFNLTQALDCVRRQRESQWAN